MKMTRLEPVTSLINTDRSIFHHLRPLIHLALDMQRQILWCTAHRIDGLLEQYFVVFGIIQNIDGFEV